MCTSGVLVLGATVGAIHTPSVLRFFGRCMHVSNRILECGFTYFGLYLVTLKYLKDLTVMKNCIQRRL